jgi:thiol-disulfide isomerase/thioredoxin
MSSLDNLNKDSNFNNLKVFPVNVGRDNALKTKNFFNDLNIQNLEIFFDSNLNLVNEFKLRGVPTTILINKKGEEFARIIGEVNFQDKKFSKWLLKYD